MKITRCEWDDVNIGHISKHKVEADEAEEILVTDSYVRRTRQEGYLAYGTTTDGKYLIVVFRYKGRGIARVITAREMTQQERRLYRKHKQRSR